MESDATSTPASAALALRDPFAAIRRPEAADLRGLVTGLPDLRAVAFNGGTAARLGRAILAGESGTALIDLPSSSPAHARPFAEKAAAWAVLGRFLG